jgi:chromate reductase, NAD(P)H dehydrogenase (quinone)
MRELRIVGLCGSLRASSTNRALLDAARLLAPPEVDFLPVMDGSVAPPFNPDLDHATKLPSKAARWRELVGAADGLIVSTPEYMAGIPGMFKNALDWLTGEPLFYQKPVAIFAASTRSLGSQEALRLVLSTMGAEIVEQSSVRLQLLGTQLSAQELLGVPGHRQAIVAGLGAFIDHIATSRRGSK